MGEEQGLSAENRALVERFYKEHAPEAVSALGTAPFNRLNALLDAARAEGLQPPVDADTLAALRLMHENRQGCVGHVQRAERRALAIVIDRLAPSEGR